VVLHLRHATPAVLTIALEALDGILLLHKFGAGLDLLDVSRLAFGALSEFSLAADVTVPAFPPLLFNDACFV